MARPTKLKTVCRRLAKALEAEDHKSAAELFATFAAADPKSRRALLGERFRRPPATLLHFAAESGNAEIARALIKMGAEVDARDGEEDTPLHLALRNEREKVALILLKAGATCEGTSSRGWSVLQEIAANPFSPRLVRAALKAGAKVNAFDHWQSSTPLHTAAYMGHTRTAELFIAAGANLEAKTDDGVTPLHLAASFDMQAMTKRLIAAGCTVNARDARKRTALHFAARQRNHRMAKLLLGHGADPSLRDDLGQTPSQIIMTFEAPKMIRALEQGHAAPAKRRPRQSLRDEICFTILLMNFPGSPDYHETSFNGQLHELGHWSSGAFSILKDALTHLAERWANQPLPREFAYPAFQVFDAIQFSAACHWHRNDGFEIEKMGADDLLEALDELRNAMTHLMGGRQARVTTVGTAGLPPL